MEEEAVEHNAECLKACGQQLKQVVVGRSATYNFPTLRRHDAQIT